MTEYTPVFEELENKENDEDCQEIYHNLLNSPITIDDLIHGTNVFNPELGELVLCVKKKKQGFHHATKLQ